MLIMLVVAVLAALVNGIISLIGRRRNLRVVSGRIQQGMDLFRSDMFGFVYDLKLVGFKVIVGVTHPFDIKRFFDARFAHFTDTANLKFLGYGLLCFSGGGQGNECEGQKNIQNGFHLTSIDSLENRLLGAVKTADATVSKKKSGVVLRSAEEPVQRWSRLRMSALGKVSIALGLIGLGQQDDRHFDDDTLQIKFERSSIVFVFKSDVKIVKAAACGLHRTAIMVAAATGVFLNRGVVNLHACEIAAAIVQVHVEAGSECRIPNHQRCCEDPFHRSEDTKNR